MLEQTTARQAGFEPRPAKWTLTSRGSVFPCGALRTVAWSSCLASPTHCLPLRCPCHARYGGVVERKNIAEKADWYIYDIQQLINALQ